MRFRSYGPLVLAAVLIVLFCFIDRKHVTYSDDKVVAGNFVNPITAIAVHASKWHFIEAGGRTYSRVKGIEPFYISVPALNSILFVTEKSGGGTIHLLNIKTGKDIQIDSQGEPFGGSIGSGFKDGEPLTDWVQKADTNSLILVSSYSHAKKVYFVDLKTQKLDKIEYEEYGKDGKVTKHSVYRNGELVE